MSLYVCNLTDRNSDYYIASVCAGHSYEKGKNEISKSLYGRLTIFSRNLEVPLHNE